MTTRSNRPTGTSRRLFLGGALGAFGVALAGLGGHAAKALGTSEAEGFVKAIVDDLLILANNGRGGAEGAAEFLALLEQNTALDAVAKFAVGRSWLDMSDAQRAAYAAAFRTYISNTYQNRFGEYSGEVIEVTGSLDVGSKGVLVNSVLKRPSAEDVAVEWLVSDRSGATKLSDIIFEGVSLAVTLRETFGGMIETRGGNIDQFIADLTTSKGA